MADEVRIDKWLWAMRIYKTRSLAAEACKKGHISIQEMPAKPSRMLKIGDVVAVRKNPITYSYRVLALTENRLGAKLVPEYMADETPPEQIEMLELNRLASNMKRAKGTGRPTKKERREIESFFGA